MVFWAFDPYDKTGNIILFNINKINNLPEINNNNNNNVTPYLIY